MSIPYSRQTIEPADVEAVVAALRSDFLTQGPYIPQFEAAFAARHQVAAAVAVSNATAALHIACLALEVGPGDLVWTSPNSFVASANCARYCGAEVGFVDIDPATRNMSVDALQARLAAADRDGRLPKVVIPVDFSGLPCDMPSIRSLADRYGFAILQDASHAVGARLAGRPVGSSYADIAVFSFHAVKIVTTAEGGICTTHSAELARRLRLLRSHGITRDEDEMETSSHGGWYYEQICLGFNYRMTELQAALGLSQLGRLDDLYARREAIAARYDQLLAPLPVTRPIRLQDRQSAHHLYVIEIEGTDSSADRRAVFDRLRAAGIGVNVHYIPIHTQPDFRRLGFRVGNFPVSERYYSRAISLPLFPSMTAAEQDRVVSVLSAALHG